MSEFKTVMKAEKDNFVVELSRTYSEAMEGYQYCVEKYSETSYLATLESKIYKTQRGAENCYNEWVRTHITN